MNNKLIKELKNMISIMKRNRKNLYIDIKLPFNQKDDAKKVKDYLNNKLGGK